MAQVSLSHTASGSCCQPFRSVRARRHFPQRVGLWFCFLPWCGQTGLLSWQNSLFEDPNQAYLHPTGFPGQNASPNLFCRWTKRYTGWDYYLGFAGMNSICQALCAGYCKLFLSSLWQIPSGWQGHFPCNPHGWRSEQGLLESDP